MIITSGSVLFNQFYFWVVNRM